MVLNAIEPGRWCPDHDRAACREELGIPDDAPVLLTVCRLFPAKGPGELVKAMPAVRKEHPTARLVIVGGEMVSGFRAELETLAQEVGVEEGVVFTGRRDDVPRLMAAADMYAMPSLGEPFGLVFLEAMAMRLPVVALDSGGTPEVVENGVTGLLSAAGDADGLTANLLQLLGDSALRAEMGARGRRRVEQRFTIGRLVADTAAVYRQLVV